MKLKSVADFGMVIFLILVGGFLFSLTGLNPIPIVVGSVVVYSMYILHKRKNKKSE